MALTVSIIDVQADDRRPRRSLSRFIVRSPSHSMSTSFLIFISRCHFIKSPKQCRQKVLGAVIFRIISTWRRLLALFAGDDCHSR